MHTHVSDFPKFGHKINILMDDQVHNILGKVVLVSVLMKFTSVRLVYRYFSVSVKNQQIMCMLHR